MPSTNYFLSIEEFANLSDLRYVNCMFASFIRTYNAQVFSRLRGLCAHLDKTLEIGESYMAKADELRPYNGYGREAFQRLNTIEEASPGTNEFRLVFGHQPRIVTKKFGDMEFEEEILDFHVIIGVRHSDGVVHWYHKFGWSATLPREVTKEDWKEIWDTYTCNPPVLFAFCEPQR